MTDEQASEMITLLRGISAKLGVKLKPKVMSASALAEWKAVMRGFAEIRTTTEPGPDPTGLPPAGGTPPSEFWSRRDPERHGR